MTAFVRAVMAPRDTPQAMENGERFSIQRQELIDAGNGRVFSRHKQSAIGKGSGVPIEVEHFSVFEVEAGLVVRIRHYLDRDEALEAAGLSP